MANFGSLAMYWSKLLVGKSVIRLILILLQRGRSGYLSILILIFDLSFRRILKSPRDVTDHKDPLL